VTNTNPKMGIDPINKEGESEKVVERESREEQKRALWANWMLVEVMRGKMCLITKFKQSIGS
jgi:hypothetical protein